MRVSGHTVEDVMAAGWVKLHHCDVCVRLDNCDVLEGV